MRRTAQAVVSSPSRRNFFHPVPAQLLCGPQKDSVEMIPHVGRWNKLTCFKTQHLQSVRSGKGHTGKNYTCSQDGAWICYLRNINFLVENQNHPASGSQHTHNCRPVMHSGAGDRRNHSESEICQKPAQKKSPICHFCNAARHFSPLPQYVCEHKGNLYLMAKRKAFF